MNTAGEKALNTMLVAVPGLDPVRPCSEPARKVPIGVAFGNPSLYVGDQPATSKLKHDDVSGLASGRGPVS